MAVLIVEKLNKSHLKDRFNCGSNTYNAFLKERAGQQQRHNTSVTWVAVEEGLHDVLGYVTLSMGRVELADISVELAAKLPKHPIPVLHVGKLAVDLSVSGKGVGTILLRLAAEQAVLASKSVGCYAIELLADSEQLVEYYKRKGFLSMKPGSLRLYQSVKTIEEAMMP